MSTWEIAAVALAIIYLVLAIRQNVACWPAAIASAAIYIVLMYQARLYMESLLQLFYIAMACYGWFNWQSRNGDELPVTSWPIAFHVVPLLAMGLLTVTAGLLLATYSDAASPYLDSFTTWGAIITTWMVARKVLQNWHYWFVIDSVSVWLYLDRGLLLTALLFVCYLFLIVIGLRQWRRSLPETG
ncbi:MAG: nicotinamide mononucleotide transporter [Chromatiales bacterium]|nr:nicotinamide mononucleotide transporter [Chromatiales bacterium]MDP6150358.1 nicotinamide riboside transporter PnuC [Gammaproteobacteria bacterium]MDP7094371.1 nicotinamide riboside transporter PnuC [Gammaproteobacteria bacterium]MDP7271762.1 nicotinamide riboside transporter PnuC [Gammaproteobacteria bacterium]